MLVVDGVVVLESLLRPLLMSQITMGPTTFSPIPISANLSVSDDEYNSFLLPFLIRAPTPIVQFHNVEYNGVKTKWMMMLVCRCNMLLLYWPL